ncbi:hypothetical protein Clacol_000456 [Clathrus columnatus]|uniref:Uncharacterized protein n=1 Tax=Clathrus columnatus TaxID=1419009 RepID=A0AAV5A310_9AGAM|nr:hypothetical protein Clacol_000456 [Clathrus columnatus]
MVKPNLSFNFSKATQNMKDLLEYAALMEFDDEDDIPSSPFTRIKIPQHSDYQKVRPTPRSENSSSPYPSKKFAGLDDLPPLESGGGPSFGYLVWKRRFEEAEKTGKHPFAYSSKRRK